MSLIRQLNLERKARLQRMNARAFHDVPMDHKKKTECNLTTTTDDEPRTPKQRLSAAILKFSPAIIVMADDEADPAPNQPERNTTTATKLRIILREVAARHGLTADNMMCEGRQANLCLARGEYFYRAMMETTASSVRIATSVNRTHHTVMNGVAVYCAEHDAAFPRGADWKFWIKRRTAKKSLRMLEAKMSAQ